MHDLTLIVSEIVDGYGYTVRAEDIVFLGLEPEQVAAFIRRKAPLGMTADQYREFTSTLRDAIESDGIDPADIRLQGSSAHFFSGHHKEMPFGYYGVDRGAVLREFWKEKREPTAAQIDEVVALLETHWPDSLIKRPKRRPFDVMHRIGISEQKSDYDVQISSHEVWRRACVWLSELGVAPAAALVEHETYAFIRKELFHNVCRAIDAWSVLWSNRLGREVTIAAFPAEGPKDHSDTIGELSSHFRDRDWIVDIGEIPV